MSDTDLALKYFLPKDDMPKLDFIRCAYLMYGDGSFVDKLYFSNKFPELHIYVISIMEKYFSISRNLWKLRILHKDPNNVKIIQNAIDYWLNTLNFSKDRLYPTISPTIFNTSNFGNGRIDIGKRFYRRRFKAIIMFLNKAVFEKKLNKKQLLVALDGILNAEGSALIDRNKKGLHKIVITVNEKEKKLVKEILKQLNLLHQFKESKQGKFVCSDWKNIYHFIKIWSMEQIQPFSLHPIRSFNCSTGFLDHKSTASLDAYIRIVAGNSGILLKDIAKKLGYRWSSVNRFINKHSRFFELRNDSYRVYLSEEGRTLLYVINTCKEWEYFSQELFIRHFATLKKYEVN